MKPPFAYVFERFPSFTQTFCAREVQELQRLGVCPQIYSIHDTAAEDIRHFPEELRSRVVVLPQGDALVEAVKSLKSAEKLPPKVVLTLRHWGDKPDKRRVHEAAWIGYHLQLAGIQHVHAHFAGLAARTCWWLRTFYRISYSFTGHANDILCPDTFEVSRAKLIADAALVVTVSDFTARYLRTTYAHESGGGKKIQRVYNGLNLEPIAAGIGSQQKSEPPMILSVGRLTEKKGFADLIAACAVLRDRGLDFRCEIIGGGELWDALAAQIASLQLGDKVILRGPQDMAQIIQKLHQATVFALACVTEADGGMDNLPTVLMEAMAAALPCVSTRLAGVPEMVVDGETGYLVPERQPEAFANAMATLLVERQRAQTFGQAGLARAREHFAMESTARQLRKTLVAWGKVTPRWAWIKQDPSLLLAKWLR